MHLDPGLTPPILRCGPLQAAGATGVAFVAATPPPADREVRLPMPGGPDAWPVPMVRSTRLNGKAQSATPNRSRGGFARDVIEAVPMTTT
jgi:hypothetical protein